MLNWFAAFVFLHPLISIGIEVVVMIGVILLLVDLFKK